MRAFRVLSCAAALVATLAPAALAQDTAEARRLTLLTFSQPVQLPGTTLPAGTYRFEIADINNAPHTVRVLSEDGQKVFGTFSTTPSTQTQRDLQDQNTLIMFAERPAGQPQAAKEWFYPGRSIGEEFIYPREQAQALADVNKTSVASSEEGKVVRVEPQSADADKAAAAGSTASTAATESSASQQARAAEQQTRQPAAQQPGPAAASQEARQNEGARPATQPSSSPVGTAGQAASSQQAASQAQPARTLPRTASRLGLFQVLSVLSLAAAFSVRRYRLRSADAR